MALLVVNKRVYKAACGHMNLQSKHMYG